MHYSIFRVLRTSFAFLFILTIPSYAQGIIDTQNNQPSINSGQVIWELVPLTDSQGNIRQVLVLKGAPSRVGIFTSKPSNSLTVEGTIEATNGFVFPDGTIQTTATLRGPKGEDGMDGTRGSPGPEGPRGPAGPATNLTTISICVDATETTNGVCSCQNNTVSTAKSPCVATSDTGQCSASGFGSPQTKTGACCVCH